MRILALITARGGSKRLPGKNIRLLGGKPLIGWSIDVVRDIAQICETLISTDDPAIAEIGVNAGASVPWLRPVDLSTDTASSIDVALHALNWYEGEKATVDGLLLLQPTSPFRTQETVRRGIELFEKNGRLPVLGVSPAPAHPMWTFRLENGYLVPFMEIPGSETRSQDLPPAYVVNGSFYLISPAQLRARRSFVGATTIPLVIETSQEALDIDTPWDFRMAELIAGDMHDVQSP